jgi:uncharacterized membrane protein YhhN
MASSIIFLAAAGLMPALLLSEKKECTAGVLATKTPLSILFILAALTTPFADAAYFRWLVAGLCCCLAGDVCLALPQPRMFLFGLVAFLCGHVMYVIAFFGLSGMGAWGWTGVLIGVPAAVGVYRWLKPHLGAMRRPVVIYIAVITLMMCGAFSVAGDARLGAGARGLVFAGALAFYLSDIFVARQRFVTPSFVNRLVGLPLYYLGQFLLAFSVGAVGLPQ